MTDFETTGGLRWSILNNGGKPPAPVEPLTEKVLQNLLLEMLTKTTNNRSGTFASIDAAVKVHQNPKDLLKAIGGERIGRGIYRDVYEVRDNPKYVIKIERKPGSGNFANACEWINYCNNRDWKKLGPWLADCLTINKTGTVLIQRKVEFRDRDKYPDKIPSVFTDTKYQNFGWIGDRFVCCDYPYFKVVGFGMRKAQWWDEENKGENK